MISNTKLPRVEDSMVKSNDALEVIKNLREDINNLPGNFLYKIPLDVKLEELQNLIEYDVDNEQPFISKMRSVWAPNVRVELINNNIQFDLKIRRKSIFSTLRKMNSIISEGKAIDSIHDLIGVEIIVNTFDEVDSEDDLRECYKVMNIFLTYLMTSDEKHHPDDRFLLCQTEGVKNAVPEKLTVAEKLSLIEVSYPNLCIPTKSDLLPEFKNFVKDYNIQPKIKSFYQGLQTSVCYIDQNNNRFYFEIQVKTQNQRKFLDSEFLPDGTPNPAYHNNFRQMQNETVSENINNSEEDFPQFDLSFSKEDIRIKGFRKVPEDDTSGILSPKIWSICNSTHNQ